MMQKPTGKKVKFDPEWSAYLKHKAQEHTNKLKLLSVLYKETNFKVCQKLFTQLRDNNQLEDNLKRAKEFVEKEKIDLEKVKFTLKIVKPETKKETKPAPVTKSETSSNLSMEQILNHISKAKQYVESVGGIHNAYLLLDFVKKL